MSSRRLGIAGATSTMALSGVIAKTISLLTLPILTSILSPQFYGAATLVTTAVSLLSVVALCGMDMSYSAAFFRQQAPNGALAERIAWQFSAAGAAAVGLIGGIVWWFWLAEAINVAPPLAVLVTLGVCLSVGSTMAQTRGRLQGRFLVIASANVLGAVLGSLGALFVATQLVANEVALLTSLFLGFSLPILLLGLPRVGGWLIRPENLPDIRSVVRIGAAGLATAPAYWLIASVDRWLLAFWTDAKTFGIYSVAGNIAVLGAMVNTALNAVWLPELARTRSIASPGAVAPVVEKMTAALLIVWLAIAMSGGDILRVLTPEPYHSGASVIPILALGVFFNGVLQINNASLVVAHHLHKALMPWLVGAGLGVLLNLTLVPSFGMLGAAVSQVLAFAAVAAGIWRAAYGSGTERFPSRRLLALSIVVGIAGVSGSFAWHASPVASLALKLPIGIASLLGVWATTDRKSMFEAMRFLRKRMLR